MCVCVVCRVCDRGVVFATSVAPAARIICALLLYRAYMCLGGRASCGFVIGSRLAVCAHSPGRCAALARTHLGLHTRRDLMPLHARMPTTCCYVNGFDFRGICTRKKDDMLLLLEQYGTTRMLGTHTRDAAADYYIGRVCVCIWFCLPAYGMVNRTTRVC